MKFKERLLQGALIKRYKRFFVDIKYQNKVITAHCPNSGSMMGLLKADNIVWFSESNNPKRKLKYTLELIETKKEKVGVNTHFTNKIVLEALRLKKVNFLSQYNNIQSEVKFSDNTRFDFLISNENKKCFVEVKNVTMVRKNKIAEFPDSVTTRGTKHLNELIKAKKKGFESCIIYLIQRNDCETFKIAEDIDQEYKFTFTKALKNGVKVLCYDCTLSTKEVKINKLVKYE